MSAVAVQRKFLRDVVPTGIERTFEPHDIIVSKTDLRGRITYANDVFLDIARMRLDEAIGAPHSLIRHPDMPRAVFKLLWDRLTGGHEVFAYVVNLARDGCHYWVFAHVTPTFDPQGSIVGYHSSRRVPSRRAVDTIIPLYQKLRELERSTANAKEGLDHSFSALQAFITSQGMDYDELVFAITQ